MSRIVVIGNSGGGKIVVRLMSLEAIADFLHRDAAAGAGS